MPKPNIGPAVKKFLYKKLNPDVPVRYQGKTVHGEHIYKGDLLPIQYVEKSRTTFPLGGLLQLGSYGSLTFRQESGFKNLLGLQGNSTKIKFMENNPGMLIYGLRSFVPGAAKSLIRRAMLIGKQRGVKYIYFDTQNPKVEKLVSELGFTYVGLDNTNSKVYLLRL